MELIEVVDRLSVGSAGELPQDTVEIVVKRTAAQWDGAPVQGYIPLLTENAARKYLRHVVAAQGSSGAEAMSHEQAAYRSVDR